MTKFDMTDCANLPECLFNELTSEGLTVTEETKTHAAIIDSEKKKAA